MAIAGFQGIKDALGGLFGKAYDYLRVPQPTSSSKSTAGSPSYLNDYYGGSTSHVGGLPKIAEVSSPGGPSAYQMQADLNSYLAASDRAMAQLNKQIAELANPKPKPLPSLPSFSVDDTFKKAREIATSSVSPYYEQTLQRFKERQQVRKTRAEEDLGLLNEDIDSQLKNVAKATALQEQRTAQDTATNIADIQTGADQFQADSATASAENIEATKEGNAAAGLTFSGIGSQKEQKVVSGKVTTEARATTQAERQKQAQQLFKTRTFEDLANSKELATAEGEKRRKTGKLNTDRLFEDLISETADRERDLEFQKQQDIESQLPSAAKDLYNKYIAALRDPEQVEYAQSIYGGSF